jgi:integrase
MRELTSFLAPFMQAYVYYQKASGRWNESSYEVGLTLFDRHCKKYYTDAIELSQEMVNSWCYKRKTENNNSCRSRIYPVISFIRYLRKRGQTKVIVPDIPRKEPRLYIPHAFTEVELKNFFSACDGILNLSQTSEQRSRKITVPVFFRLLYSSGIRTNEARMLKTEDVDLVQGVLNIRYSKGHAQHYIALHDSMLELMKKYDTAIRKQYPNRTYFFPARNDGCHKRAWVQKNFRQMWDSYNGSRATAYEFRHHYAIENINSWTDEGFGFDGKLLYLSKSMGHSVLESTKYYYSLVPGLADILEAQTDDSIIPEVKDYESL